MSFINYATLEHVNVNNDNFKKRNIYHHGITFFLYDIVCYMQTVREPKLPTFITLVASESHATCLFGVLAVDVGKVFFKGCAIKTV